MYLTGGKLEVIVGPMYSGKTEELIRRAVRLMYAKLRVKAFDHILDNRFGDGKIASRSGFYLESTPIENFKFKDDELTDLINTYDAIIIDEAQFFDDSIVDFVKFARECGLRIIVSGLDMDVNGKPFGHVPELLAIADEVTKLKSVCFDCGEDASISYRTIQDDRQIVVGNKEYIALCWSCYNYRKNYGDN